MLEPPDLAAHELQRTTSTSYSNITMLSRILSVLVLSISIVNAFRDTSPFFFFSTSEVLFSSPQIVKPGALIASINEAFQKCPSDTYVIVSQPAVNAADYHDPEAAPRLRRNIGGENKNIRSSITVSDVLGSLDAESVSRQLQEKCGAEVVRIDASTRSFAVPEGTKTRVINLDFLAPPPGRDRVSKLEENDSFLQSVLDALPSTKYTVLYTTSPIAPELLAAIAEGENYKLDTNFHSALNMDLRRDFSSHIKREPSNHTLADRTVPLFEKYQFFGPGLFMGLLVSFLLLSILYVGIRGIASLEVSYAAFDKELGPAMSKK